ncbi:hypothetical protein F5I97DRAFT_1810893 [Phlebopus sp. FC_14]|nr:hypothetical protein F5I97DRAFT_1810893 [Phlebopus sp. FC_14]
MTTLVDDNDPRIMYTGLWFTSGVSPEYHNTTHGTYAAGSSASFNFTGTSISVFGTVGPANLYAEENRPPISMYNLDDSPAVFFTGPLLNSASYHYQFYTSPPLDAGIHSLVITSVNMSNTLWLDYLQYTGVNGKYGHQIFQIS